MSEKQKIVVVGNGMAGARFVEDLLARGGGDRFDVVMFGDEPYGNYNRILLSGVLAGSHAAQDIFMNPLAWYTEKGILLHAGVRVTSIDADEQTVTGDNGVVEFYDKLVLATGSSAFVPPIAGLKTSNGAFKPGAFVFRTLDDCAAITASAKNAKKAIVVGGGLLGLEAARGLLEQGLEVHVVHLMGHLMELQIDAFGGTILQKSLEKMGLHVHLKKNTSEVIGEERIKGVRFADGSSMDCDLLVISAGIRPNTQLAREAGILVERGIVVGDNLQTDVPNIFAVGECIQHRGRTYGLVAPCWEQGQTLADRLSGKNPRAVYAGSKISTKLKVMGLDLAVMGARDKTQEDEEEVSYVEQSRGVYKKLVVRDGKLAGAILLGDTTAAPDLFRLFDKGNALPVSRSDVLFPAAAGGGKAASILEAADELQVCNCNGVSKGQIAAAAKKCRSLKQLCDSTRAGTGCGACKSDVTKLWEANAGDSAAVEDPSIHYYVPGVPLSKPELVQAIRAQNLRSVSAVFRDLANGREDTASKIGLASLLKTVWGKDYVDERDARFVNDRVHANIQKDGTYSVVPRIFGGVTTPADLKRIAEVAERYDVPMVKFTGGQRIDLLGIKKDALPAVWRELGMPSGHAYTKAFRTCKTCVGSEFCRYGVGDSTALGIAIEKRYQGLETPAKLKLATAGCPRNCSEATVKDIGAVAVEGGRWEIYVGGAAGAHVRKGDLLSVETSHDNVIRMMGRFMQYYRERAKYSERTYDFVTRLGIEHIRKVLLEDSEGIVKQLDEGIEAAVQAFVDPWTEANKPHHPTQFAEVLPAKEEPRTVTTREAALEEAFS